MMETSRFSKAPINNEYDYREPDRIDGTTKIRTFCANDSLYSQESDIKKIARSIYGHARQDTKRN